MKENLSKKWMKEKNGLVCLEIKRQEIRRRGGIKDKDGHITS